MSWPIAHMEWKAQKAKNCCLLCLMHNANNLLYESVVSQCLHSNCTTKKEEEEEHNNNNINYNH